MTDSGLQTRAVQMQDQQAMAVVTQGAVPDRIEPFGDFEIAVIRELYDRNQRNIDDPILVPGTVIEILNDVANFGSPLRSCKARSISYRSWEGLITRCPPIKDMLAKALDCYRLRIEAAVHNRAIEGWLEPVYNTATGALIGYKRRFSDRMLELLAKRHIPEFREAQSVDVQVSSGALIVPAPAISEERWLVEAAARKRVPNAAENED